MIIAAKNIKDANAVQKENVISVLISIQNYMNGFRYIYCGKNNLMIE